MEPEWLALEASWSSVDPTMESEVMAQLFGPHNEQDQDPGIEIQQMFWSDHNADSYYSSDNSNCNPYYWPQGTCSTSANNTAGLLHMPANDEGYCLLEPHMIPAISVSSSAVNFSENVEKIATPSFPGGVHHHADGLVCMNEETSSDEIVESVAKPLLSAAHASQAVKRRLHVGDGQMESSKRKAMAMAPVTKKAKNAVSQKSVSNANEEESNADVNPRSSCCYSSEDDSNGSQELKGAGAMSPSSDGSAALNPSGKKRAGRGSATDPQSLYARKRREKINERLRILQKLVPNGTKVDISTMLEEAAQYVKFLQLQIKLLSSDELWMYAPIAYNGMNLGLDLQTSK